jgi:hypothetical protein
MAQVCDLGGYRVGPRPLVVYAEKPRHERRWEGVGIPVLPRRRNVAKKKGRKEAMGCVPSPQQLVAECVGNCTRQ